MVIGLRHREAASLQETRRIMGIDPGTVVTGWGVVETMQGNLVHLDHGTIGAARNLGMESRLSRIYHGLLEVVNRHQPQAVSLEKVFFARNPESALKLGHARGVALLAAAESHVDVYEYSTAEIKQAVVGYGQASKEQVQKMVVSLLHLSGELPKDASDALAAAICYLHQQPFHTRLLDATCGAERGIPMKNSLKKIGRASGF